MPVPTLPPDLHAPGRAVKAIRAEQGISQAQLAAASGLHQTWISHIENGRRNPSWTNIARLAGGLGVSIVQLAARVEAERGERPQTPSQG